MAIAAVFSTETNDARWNDCTFCAFAMGVSFWYDRTVDKEQIRIASGLPELHSGATLMQAHAALNKLNLPTDNLTISPFEASLTADDLYQRLKLWGGAVVCVDYGKLPVHYSRWDRHFASINGKHAAFCYGIDERGMTFWMDPLGRGRYIGEPMAWGDLAHALLADNGHVYTAVSEGVSMGIYLPVSTTTGQVATIAPNTRLYRTPSTFSPSTASGAAPAVMDYLGYVEGDSNWLAVGLPHGTLRVTRYIRKDRATLAAR